MSAARTASACGRGARLSAHISTVPGTRYGVPVTQAPATHQPHPSVPAEWRAIQQEPYGTVVCAGQSFPITGVRLERGGLTLTVDSIVTSDVPQAARAPMELIGSDGKRLPTTGGWLNMPAKARGERVRITVECDFEQVASNPG